jgi:hypothetical protein
MHAPLSASLRAPRAAATAALRAAAAAACCAATVLALCGFVRIHDEAVIGGDGGALARRSVSLEGVRSMEELFHQVEQDFLTPEQREEIHAHDRDLRGAICRSIVAKRDGWTSARFSDSSLVVERRYASGDSPFSSAEIGQVTFALHHWLGNGITRPEFPLVGVGPVMRDDAEHRAYIAGLVAHGYAHDLTIRMPGRIRLLWSERVRDAGRVVKIDLLEEWPDERDTFIVSDADLLHTGWFITLGIAAFMIGMLVMLRRLEGK